MLASGFAKLAKKGTPPTIFFTVYGLWLPSSYMGRDDYASHTQGKGAFVRRPRFPASATCLSFDLRSPGVLVCCELTDCCYSQVCIFYLATAEN
ncbi:hypothetical protein RRG08_009298 [Elysia crispata]|uniref:Uncharacterized protein n=1 Tax=Elysia crispata TaxID=231223 RepID=A0AAE0Y981_9GAST|nr:hypothetical protein RRG08_009298 [Elysia crispata]